jgi:DNA-binding NtrC family response regulator
MATILVVDDESVIQDVVRLALTDARHDIVAARSGEAALQSAGREKPDLVIIDNKLPGIDGLETLRRLRVADPGLPAIVLTGYASLPNAVDALRHGVLDYVSKPFRPGELTAAVERALAGRAVKPRLTTKPATGASNPGGDPFYEARGGLPGFDDIVGDCPAMREVFRLIPRVAATDEPVLIAGETGTGKELVAPGDPPSLAASQGTVR